MFSRTQLVTLKAVLDADVPTYGALNDQDAAVALNALTETRIRASMSGSDIAKLIDATEYDAAVSADKAVVVSLCGIDSLDPANGGLVHQTIVTIFGNNTTAANIIAARDESISPATLAGLPRVRADFVRIARTI